MNTPRGATNFLLRFLGTALIVLTCAAAEHGIWLCFVLGAFLYLEGVWG